MHNVSLERYGGTLGDSARLKGQFLPLLWPSNAAEAPPVQHYLLARVRRAPVLERVHVYVIILLFQLEKKSHLNK